MDHFDKPDMKDMPDTSSPVEGSAVEGSKVREMDRDSLFMQGVLHIPGHAQPITVRVRNLSAGGLMADFAGSLAKGSPLEIELRTVGVVGGRVAWSSATQFGMTFDTPIDPHAVRRPIGVKKDDLFRPVTLGKYDNYKRSL